MDRTSLDEPLQLRVEGLDCPAEVELLQRAVGPLVEDSEQLSFDLLQGRMTIAAPRAQYRANDFIQAIERAGLRATRWTSTAQRQSQADSHSRALFWTTVISGAALLVGLLADRLQQDAAARLAFAVSILCGSLPIWPRAWQALRLGRPDMHLLMAIAVLGAIALGEWNEAAAVAFLFAVSLRLESWSVGRARQAIARLMDLKPATARWQVDGQEFVGPAEDVPLEARVVVRAGERIPVDGQVIEGESAVDQSPITGESQPVEKSNGASVYAGTINGAGSLLLRCTHRAEDSQLARIVQYVQAAHTRRAPSQRWVDRFAAVYTPLVLLFAASIWLIPPLLMGQSWSQWTYNGLVLLVIACPCALVISTPVSVVAAIAHAARQGVLIKGGLFVELPAHLQAIAFDKTGTLTRGQLALQDVRVRSSTTREAALRQACQLEYGQHHPIARAIMAAGHAAGIVVPHEGSDTLPAGRLLPGRGTSTRIGDHDHWIGSPREARQRGAVDDWVTEQLKDLSAKGQTAVVLGRGDHTEAVLGLVDEPRANAAHMIRELRQLGVRTIVMLTGDVSSTAQRIAEPLGLDDVAAELLPADKVDKVRSLVHQHQQVAMIGDGVNDAPALAAATMGIAMGAMGSDVALESADVALMTDDLEKIPWLIRHARRTLRIIRQNVYFSVAIKLLFIALTLVGCASLWLAILADTGAALLVTANALTLLRAAR
jgi:Cd2+/Zn2+-exporting ATPase